MTEGITGTESLIEKVCRKCIYYRKVCWFDYGDSMTKIPCNALKVLYELSRKRKERERLGLRLEQIFLREKYKEFEGGKNMNHNLENPRCPKCGSITQKLGFRVVLFGVRIQRYKCITCGKTFSPSKWEFIKS